MVSFAGSMFAGVMKGATDSFSEKGLGGQLYNSIIAKQGRDLLDQQKRDSAAAGTGGFYGTQESGSSTPPAGGAGTPYGTPSSGADTPTAGAPYVQEKPKPAPPPPPLKPFETITGDPAKGGPPPGMDTPTSAIPVTPATPSALPPVVQQQFPAAVTGKPPAFTQIPTPPQSRGRYPWFIPDAWINPQKTNPDGTPYTGPVIGQPNAAPNAAPSGQQALPLTPPT